MCISTQLDDVVQATIRLHTHTHTHAHTHTRACTQTLLRLLGRRTITITQLKRSEKRNVSSLPLKEGRVSSRVSDVTGEVVLDVRTDVGGRARAMNCNWRLSSSVDIRRSLSVALFGLLQAAMFWLVEPGRKPLHCDLLHAQKTGQLRVFTRRDLISASVVLDGERRFPGITPPASLFFVVVFCFHHSHMDLSADRQWGKCSFKRPHIHQQSLLD